MYFRAMLLLPSLQFIVGICTGSIINSGGGGGGSTFVASCRSRTDCSDELQTAIYSGAPTIRIPDIGFPWRVCKVTGQVMDGLVMNISNTVLIFDPGVIVEAAPGCFGSFLDPNSTATLLSTRNRGAHACYPDFLGAPACSDNVTILGYGATLRMRKHEYTNASIYPHNAYRGGLYIYRASRFAVFGLTVTLTGGDGLYIHECAQCRFVGLNLTDNYRQACSVIAARDTLFENCSFVNTGMTGGIAPQAGVDFEPNGPTDYLTNLTLRNCHAQNNVGGGFMLSYGNLNNHSEPISVSFEDCTVDGMHDNNNYGLYAYGLPFYPDKEANAVNGTIRWHGGYISNTRLCSFAIDVPVCSGMTVEIKDVQINGTRVRSEGPFATSPLVVGMWAGATNTGLRKPSGRVTFTNVTVHDTIKRPFLQVNSTSEHVHGDFFVVNDQGCEVALAEPCPGCAAAAPLAQRDVNVTFECQTAVEAVVFEKGQRHSFVDTSLLEDPEAAGASGLVLRQQPFDHDFGFLAPLITADAPWERGCLVASYSSVFQEQPGGRALLFYQLYCSMDPDKRMAFGSGTVSMVALAESVDGLRWTKPIVNKIAFRNSSQNNLVMFPKGDVATMAELEGASIFRDPGSGKLVSVAALGTKLAVFTAADTRGFDWQQTALWEVGFDDSQSILFWDTPRNEYALYTRAKTGDTQYFPSEVRGVRRLSVHSLEAPGLPVRRTLWDNDFGK